MDAYQHSALRDSRKEIRLLHLQELNGEYFTCALSHCLIEEDTEWIAISYVWGDVSSQHTISINDNAFKITTRCFEALQQTYQHLRRTGRLNVRIWIDSICINQLNLEEKSNQVSIMGDVFEKASSVVACLGDHADDSDILMKHLSAITEVTGSLDLTGNPDTDRRTSVLACGDYVNSLAQDDLELLSHATKAFGNRPYWKRVWILQEVALARWLDILCGSDWTYWTVLDDLFCVLRDDPPVGVPKTSFHSKEKLTKDLFDGLQGLKIEESQMLRYADGPPKKPIDFFLWSPDFECFDVRDRIFGALRLIEWPEDLPPIEADYSKPVFDVAREALNYFRKEYDRGPDNLIEFGWDLAEALHVTPDDEGFKEYIVKASESTSIGNILYASAPADRNHVQQRFRVRIPRRHYCSLISQPSDHRRKLKAALIKSRSYTGFIEPIKQIIDSAKSMTDIVELMRDPEELSTIAILGYRSLAGDILLQPFLDSPVLLVLREVDSTYKIVCTGVCACERYYICTDGPACQCFDDQELEGSLDLYLDEADLWAYLSSAWLLQSKRRTPAQSEQVLRQVISSFCLSRLSSYAVAATDP